MKKKIKTVLRSFDYMHCDDFAMYLSEMAAKGWHFKEWGTGMSVCVCFFEKAKAEKKNKEWAGSIYRKLAE